MELKLLLALAAKMQMTLLFPTGVEVIKCYQIIHFNFRQNKLKSANFRSLTLASLEIIAKKESDVITIFSVFSQASIIRDLRMGTWTKEEDFSRLTSQRKKSTGGDRI